MIDPKYIFFCSIIIITWKHFININKKCTYLKLLLIFAYTSIDWSSKLYLTMFLLLFLQLTRYNISFILLKIFHSYLKIKLWFVISFVSYILWDIKQYFLVNWKIINKFNLFIEFKNFLIIFWAHLSVIIFFILTWRISFLLLTLFWQCLIILYVLNILNWLNKLIRILKIRIYLIFIAYILGCGIILILIYFT